jgi:hypothetical protein
MAGYMTQEAYVLFAVAVAEPKKVAMVMVYYEIHDIQDGDLPQT